MFVDWRRNATISMLALLISCTPLAAPNAPSPLANDPVMFFTAHFYMASPVSRNTEHKLFFFFLDPDAVIYVVPTLGDDPRKHHNQKSLFLSKLGELKCTDRSNPPQLRDFTYYQECARLVSRMGNSFVLDYTSHGAGSFPGGSEFRNRGRLAVQISNGRCTAQLQEPQRSYVNMPTDMVALTVQSYECLRVAPPD